MKRFNHESAQSFEDASALLQSRGAVAIAGGTDLLGVLKDDLLPDYPETVVDLKTVEGSKGVEYKDGQLLISALTTLKEVASSDAVRRHCPILAEAAKNVATPSIRNMGTVGGNLCQDVRCWFYRYPHEAGGRLVCSRKGGDTCYALQGDNRYHSVFGGMKANITPCARECPAGTDIPAYTEQIRKGNLPEAARIIMRYNPLPMITSRVCAHTCQEKCNRVITDESVAISSLERHVGDYILEHAGEFYIKPDSESGRKTAVVGGGCAGLAAAYYLRMSGNQVTVYDSKEEAGGMLMYAIPAYRLPKETVRKFIRALSDMGIEFKCGVTVGKDVTPEKLEDTYDSVFYSTGTWKRPVIGISGEELTEFGLDFLIEVNTWMKGKIGTNVLVTGGGNVAMDVAVTAKRLGAKNVTLACLESEAEMPASKEEIARAREENIEILPSWGLSGVLAEGGKVTGMKLKRCISVRDESGRFNPQYDENEEMIAPAESILMAVGQLADLSFLDDKYQVQLNQRGLIDVDLETQQTSRKGIFAGGDATTGPTTVIQAIAAGRKGARGINRYLGVKSENLSSQGDTPFLTFDCDGAKKQTAAKLRERPMAERVLDQEDAFSLDSEDALEEAERCLNCGCYAVNPSDMAPALVAAGAVIVTNLRELSAAEFCATKLKVTDILKTGEIVKEIRVPAAGQKSVTRYDKFRLRDAIDFAIVSLSTVFDVEDGAISKASIVLGGAAPIPVRLTHVEEYVTGKEITEELAQKAGELATKGTLPMSRNTYKTAEISALLKKAVLRLI
jgi:NADPH-dependent glutamate synthase beta subunit-like oxidoreductase